MADQFLTAATTPQATRARETVAMRMVNCHATGPVINFWIQAVRGQPPRTRNKMEGASSTKEMMTDRRRNALFKALSVRADGIKGGDSGWVSCRSMRSRWATRESSRLSAPSGAAARAA